MARIDWDEFKEFKKHSVKEDKLAILTDFIKSYYNISNAGDMYGMIKNDDVGIMFLERNDIQSAEGLESFIRRS